MRLHRSSALLAASALALVALAFYAGVAPGSSATIAVDNCFVSYDMLERPTYWCDGHWTRLGVSVQGRVAGLDTATFRAREETNPSTPGSAGNGDLYLTVPSADRSPVGFADLWRAYAVPGFLPVTVRICTGVLACAWLVALTVALRRRHRRVSVASPDEPEQ